MNENEKEYRAYLKGYIEQALYIVAGEDTELFNEAKAAVINEIKGINEVRNERLIQ
mgnify:CR=1 FL=1|jgi:hypothetical protein